MVVLCRLLAHHCDFGGYETLVFENLDKDRPKNLKYIMCVKYPNWDNPSIKINDEGYLQYEERRAGIDEWWDGTKFVKYNYDAIQFIKFIPKQPLDDQITYVL